MIKAVLFDKDGTLIDFMATFGPATRSVIEDVSGGNDDRAVAMAEAAGFDLETGCIEPGSVLIAGSLVNIADCWQSFALTAHQDGFVERLDKLYQRYSLQSITPFPSLEETLKTLQKEGFVLGIATNDSEEAARSHMEKLGVLDRFDFIAGYDSGHGEKPGPGMVKAFSAHCDLATSAIAMVGDSVHDCQAGRAAGAVAIAVTSGLATAEDLLPHADHVLAGIEELPAFIEKLHLKAGPSS